MFKINVVLLVCMRVRFDQHQLNGHQLFEVWVISSTSVSYPFEVNWMPLQPISLRIAVSIDVYSVGFGINLPITDINKINVNILKKH